VQPTPSVAPNDVRYKAPIETPAQYTPQNQVLDGDGDDDGYFIELQHVGYKNLYPYRPAKTA
jgi:hypothetical protein